MLNMSPKGLNFARAVKTLVAAGNDRTAAADIAARVYGPGSEAAKIVKAATAAGSTIPGGWGSDLTSLSGGSAEFIASAAAQTIVPRLPDLQRVPFDTRIVAEDVKARAVFVKEGSPIPIFAIDVSGRKLPQRKVASILVISRELAESSDPSAELLIRNSLMRAVAATVDDRFLDAANAGSLIEPASPLNGAPTLSSSGEDIESIVGDIRSLIAQFSGRLDRACIVANPALFVAMSLSGRFPDVGAAGGEIAGISALPSSSESLIERSFDSPERPPKYRMAILDGSSISYAEGETEVRVSDSGTVQMDDEPTTQNALTGAGVSQVSLWQTNCRAVKISRVVNWSPVRPAAALMQHINWSGTPAIP